MKIPPESHGEFPLLLEPHEEALGFGRYIIAEHFAQRFAPPEVITVVLCPIGPSDAVFKIKMVSNGMIKYQQKIFGRDLSFSRRPPIWHPTQIEALDAAMTLKKVDLKFEPDYLKIERVPYDFKQA